MPKLANNVLITVLEDAPKPRRARPWRLAAWQGQSPTHACTLLKVSRWWKVDIVISSETFPQKNTTKQLECFQRVLFPCPACMITAGEFQAHPGHTPVPTCWTCMTCVLGRFVQQYCCPFTVYAGYTCPQPPANRVHWCIP